MTPPRSSFFIFFLFSIILNIPPFSCFSPPFFCHTQNKPHHRSSQYIECVDLRGHNETNQIKKQPLTQRGRELGIATLSISVFYFFFFHPFFFFFLLYNPIPLPHTQKKKTIRGGTKKKQSSKHSKQKDYILHHPFNPLHPHPPQIIHSIRRPFFFLPFVAMSVNNATRLSTVSRRWCQTVASPGARGGREPYGNFIPHERRSTDEFGIPGDAEVERSKYDTRLWRLQNEEWRAGESDDLWELLFPVDAGQLRKLVSVKPYWMNSYARWVHKSHEYASYVIDLFFRCKPRNRCRTAWLGVHLVQPVCTKAHCHKRALYYKPTFFECWN